MKHISMYAIQRLHSLFAAVIAIALLLSAAVPVSAQTFTISNDQQANEELIIYLLSVIAQLQAQQQNQSVVIQSPQPVVLGENTFGNDINVTTGLVRDTDSDETIMRGSVYLGGASSAEVWFEYGEDDDANDDETTAFQVSGSGVVQFERRVSDLDSGEVYYYRAVSEVSNGQRDEGKVRSFRTDGRSTTRSSRNDDEPDVTTLAARDIGDDRAELRGEVDMNDFNNGLVFFVYGEDEDTVEDVEREDQFDDIDEDGDDLQLERVDSDLDDEENYEERITGLDDDTDYFYRICVEYEDEDDDDTLECGSVREFNTDDDRTSSSNSNGDDEPDVSTESARDIGDDRAELRGEVDMNDFNNGLVFFVYGEDEDAVEDADRENRFNNIDEDGDDLQKVRIDDDLDGQRNYFEGVTGLGEDVEYYFRICVEYEDKDDDDTLECGSVRSFTTDDDDGSNRSGNDDDPFAVTQIATDVEDESAVLRGEVDMNDFNNGLVFFVYGEDEDEVEDASREDEVSRITISGDDIQIEVVDGDLDGSEEYEEEVFGLDDNTEHYFRICVEYDDDEDPRLECGSVRGFETD